MMDRTLLVLGAGGHGKSVAEAALLSGEWIRVLFLDDGWPHLNQALGWPVVGKVTSIAEWADRCHGAFAAVGSNSVREAWVGLIEDAGIELVSIVHPHAWVSASAQIAPGTAIMAGAVVGTDSSVGRGTIINCNTTLDHDAVLSDFVHLGVGVQLAGGVKVGAGAWLQAGSCCGYRVVVEAGVIYSPGSVLNSGG